MLTPGDIADRLAVLSIKATDGMPVTEELNLAETAWEQFRPTDRELDNLYLKLLRVHLRSWDCVEQIYKEFDSEDYGGEQWKITDIEKAQESIKNYRKAHELNKERVRLKNLINQRLGAAQEQKSWKAFPSSTTSP